MSTDPETTENTAPGVAARGAADTGRAAPDADPAAQGEVAGDAAPGEGAHGEGVDGAPRDDVTDAGTAGADADPVGQSPFEGDGESAAQRSEAEAELAAQRIERERIERRKAEKRGPIDSGAKLSGKAADLLAAVRAVESGQKPVATVFGEPERAPRRPAPEPVRRPQPTPAAPAAAPAPETVGAVGRVLADGGAPEALAPQVTAALGEGADEQLRSDPWLLLRVGGVRPEQADGFARALLGTECRPDDERRGRALTGWLLEQAALAGHTALEMSALIAALAQRAVPDAESAVQSAIAEGEALVFQDALDPTAPAPEPAEDGEEAEERPVRVLIGLERYALAEESLADGLARLINSVPKQDGSAEDWERAAAAAHGSTAELVRAVAGHGLVLHTGGEASRAEPAALLEVAAGLGLRAWAATHTPGGRDRFAAALRAGQGQGNSGQVQEGAGPGLRSDGPDAYRATTVAGLLSGVEGPGRDADGALDLDLLVVLDAPQLDVETAALLIESLPDGARLVLSGDPAVLWSAGPGRVFADLLAARICPRVSSRLPDSGPLGELVSGIGIGELGQVDAPGKEVVIVPVRDAGEAVHRTVQLVADSVPRAIGVPPEQTVVITPGHGGAAGTRALNAALKERLNPGPGRFGGFDPGDRIAYSPAPGRTVPGTVVKADADGLHLSCSGLPVVVAKERVEQSVRHGWALTAHQAVGDRWPAVVAVLPGDAVPALSRPWIYTAFGRADRHLSVVHGVEQALPRAVAKVVAKPRTTRLPLLLATQVPATG
ncbi:helix-hairpin-helix domain-containing protein [Streptomyces sp. NBC_00588]|uniref:helix-hairpin-helix domain-containing protein n=1 Tax=Streptomyces sp. NBC_00588 TaxID=2975784 RepID=UPI002E7FC025|nr:helix-hairpin-helix domain-containing protein [Streptomyces sp. NBC_00588]WUB39511.1 DNA helicase RecD [Streptomyces sp. NBC_00588]